LFELITLGVEPYPNMSRQEVIYEVSENHYRMEKPEGICTDAYYQIMTRCWNEDPLRRPTFDSLYNFFNDYVINTQPQYQLTSNVPQITAVRPKTPPPKKKRFFNFFRRN